MRVVPSGPEVSEIHWPRHDIYWKPFATGKDPSGIDWPDVAAAKSAALSQLSGPWQSHPRSVVTGPTRKGGFGVPVGGHRNLHRSRRPCSRHAHAHMVPARVLDDLSIIEGRAVTGSKDQPGLLVARIPACFPFRGRGPSPLLSESARGDESCCSKDTQSRITHIGAHVVSIAHFMNDNRFGP